ncbi:exodeoxyribonuclease VII small subunit [Anaerovibrio sp.]|uniref:exodeoxyribonuclease VII small subunit n=1 Tax=Anaerovibrio sp. TaxID=1872532 RepID=UPI001B7134E3|nr:exodeoxyribonuclease VII small subunit [Anaerovibrio sp.]MBP3230681.1 exodeoxyribonuclease VII small subunit [Anaerovibrio sp.]MBR2143444.1 exodeoxyribonuclease VII small subunit [Anaerovibrio sp.]
MPRKKEPTFEENLAQLEQIVEKLESGQTSLKDVMENYTLGMELSKRCLDELRTVEKQMDAILRENGDEVLAEPLVLGGIDGGQNPVE